MEEIADADRVCVPHASLAAPLLVILLIFTLAGAGD
jgi:hypothetical protein